MSLSAGCRGIRRARQVWGYSLAMLTISLAPSTQGTDAIAECSPLPAVLRFTGPLYPKLVESRGLPNPVWVLVEFIVSTSGRASQVRVVETDAGTYRREFGDEAIQSMGTVQFKPIAQPCRGRMRIVFKLAD